MAIRFNVTMCPMHSRPPLMLILLLTLAWLSGCRGESPVAVTEAPPATLPGISRSSTATPVGAQPESAFPSATPEQERAASPEPPLDNPTPAPAAETEALRTQYQLQAEINYGRHQVRVQEEIHYTNRSSDTLDHLLLVVEPASYPDGLILETIQTVDGSPLPEPAWESLRHLRITLPAPLSPGQQIGLAISYVLNLPSPSPSAEVRPIPYGYTTRQTNLVDWYPFIPPYQPGKGWLAHPAGYYGEHLVYETADFDVRLRLEDARSDLVIAASAAESLEGDWHVYQHLAARNFALSIGPEYKVTSAQVGNVTVTGYAFPFHTVAGEAALKATVDALALYQDLFGPYPRHTLSVVEADFLDGMEYDGLYFLSNGFYNLYTGTPSEYLIAIAAHETAHQWWYALVGNDQAMEPWLDEALCTYSERLFFEHYYPEALDWWWAYRIQYYEPAGWVDTTIYNPQASAQPYAAYRSAVYLNGAVFFEDLRKAMGDASFFSFLKRYAETYGGQIASRTGFVELLNASSPVDLQGVLAQYLSGP